jgi:HPt (histidine-containing phosphotransfer) domain-containing protein
MEYKKINTEYILSATDGDVSIITNIVDLFVEQVAESYLEMKSLFEAKDYFNLGLLAHKVKSSAAIFGMDELATMLKTFELQAKNSENVQAYPDYILMFNNYCQDAIVELNNFINELNSK